MQVSLTFQCGRLDCREEALRTVSGGTLDLGPRRSGRSSFPEGGEGSNWAKGATGVESKQRLTVPRRAVFLEHAEHEEYPER